MRERTVETNKLNVKVFFLCVWESSSDEIDCIY